MHSSSSRAGGAYRQGRQVSRDSGTSQDSYKEHYGGEQRGTSSSRDQHHHHHHHGGNHHPRHSSSSESKHGHRGGSGSGSGGGHPRNTNGTRGSETIGFIPGSADNAAAGGRHACGSCASMGWSGCRALICCVLTCGFYGSREPCLPVNESSTDHLSGSKAGSEGAHPAGVNGTTGVSNPAAPLEPAKNKSAKLAGDSFRYPDVRIRGQTVDYPRHYPPEPARTRAAAGKKPGESQQRPISNTSLYSREDLDLDDLSDADTDIDSLITKKLLELYKLHQIDQLAKCTSDSSFQTKTNEISELIYSIAQDYNLEEQEAECKLVHGVIRISTRKGKRTRNAAQAQRHNNNGRSDGTLPDSGNETMTITYSSDMPDIKVSAERSSDELARKMRHYSERTYSSSTTTAYSPYHHETETDSSGAPLLYVL